MRRERPVSDSTSSPKDRATPASRATRARIQALAEQPLTVEEWRERQAVPITDAEHEGTMELVRWFVRRYPTPSTRLAYVRRAYRRWLKVVGPHGA